MFSVDMTHARNHPLSIFLFFSSCIIIDNIQYSKLLPTNNKEEVLDFFDQHYVREEPFCAYQVSAGHLGRNWSTNLSKTIDENLSIVARDLNSKMVGVLLNSEIRANDPLINRCGEVHKDSFTRIRLDRPVDNQLFDFQQILKAHNVKKMLRVGKAVVHRDYRNKGISKNYWWVTKSYYQNEYQYAITVCTSLYSKLAIESLGFTLWDELRYENVLVDGKHFFDTDDFNRSCKCYIKELSV